MKEHKDEVLSSGKESTGTVDSTTSDEIVTRRGKIEGLFGERDGVDMVVDVVSADMVVDEVGGAKVDSGGKVEEGLEKETGTRDCVMEDVGVVKEGSDDVVGSRVEALQKVAVVVVSEEGVKGSVEVVKEVIQENVVTAVVSGLDSGDEKSRKKPVIGDSKTVCEASSKEVKARGGEIEVTESVQEVADEDHVVDEKTHKETEVLSSSKIQESTEGHVVTEEGLDGKDKAEDGVNNRGSLNEVVNAGGCEDNAHVNTKNTESQAGVGETKKEIFQSTIEATTNDSQKSGNGTQVGESKMVVELDRGVTEEKVERPSESVQEVADGDCVMSEKTGKDKVLDSAKIPDSVTKVDEVITKEGLSGKDETQGGVAEDQSSLCPDKPSLLSETVNKETRAGAAFHENASSVDQNADKMNKEEKSQSATEVGTHDASNSGKETEVGDSKMEDEPETVKGETDVIDKGDEKETLEQSVNSVQEVTKGDPDSSKTPQSSIMASLGLEEVDVVAVDEGLEGKNKAQDRASFEPSLVNPDHQSTKVVEDVIGEVGQKAEVDSTSKNENSSIKPEDVDACSKVVKVTIAQKEPNLDVQVSTDGGILVENQSSNVDTVADSSKPDIVACAEPEYSIDKMTPGIANKVLEKDIGVQTLKVEPAAIGCESSVFQVDQGLNANHSNPGNEITASHIRVPDSTVEVPTTGEPQTYSEDAGMDIDEVLGWKDEIPSAQEDQQKVDPTNLSNVEVKETEALEPPLESEQWNKTSVSLQQSCYFHPPETEGIKQESSRRHGVDKSASVSSFEPDMLVDYVRSLAKCPHGEGDKMELTMAKAQLSSYGRFKGHRQLAEFQLCGDLLEVEQVIKDETYSEDGSKKRKALDSISDGSEKRPTMQTDTVTPKPSFKVGESIQKVANQLTGPPEQVTGNIVSVQGRGPAQLGNQVDMLSQLHLAAQDPMKGYSFVDNIIPYFNSHRTAVVNKSRLNSSNDAKKRKALNENETEEFEFDDVNDSYWTDRIIQNYTEENPLQESQNGGVQHQIVAYEQEKPVKPTRRSNKKRFFSSNHEIEAKEQSELIERRRKNLATEVLMKFTEGIYFPSEIHLNKMFRRFGPLMESETEVDRAGGRARVVFKKCSDAEVAHSSAGKFNIFGSINVSYELNYTPLISYKPLPLPTTQDPAHAC